MVSWICRLVLFTATITILTQFSCRIESVEPSRAISTGGATQPAIPRISSSKTWTAVSTVRKVSLDENHATSDPHSRVIISTVQSRPHVPRSKSALNTRRTSVSIVRKPSEANSQKGGGAQHSDYQKVLNDIQMGSIVDKAISAAPCAAQDVRKLDVSSEIAADNGSKALHGKNLGRSWALPVIRLGNPAWNNGFMQQSTSTAAQSPRRSKKSSGHATATARARRVPRPYNHNDADEDDISPTTSITTDLPRPVSVDTNSPSPNAVLHIRPPISYSSTSQDCSDHVADITNRQDLVPASIPRNKVAELRSIFDTQDLPAYPGDGSFHRSADETGTAKARRKSSASRNKKSNAQTRLRSGDKSSSGDTGIPSNCTMFTSPFRRDSCSARPSLVRQRISVFERLANPSESRKARRQKLKPDQANSQTCHLDASTNHAQKKPSSWWAKSLQKMSFHKTVSQKRIDEKTQSG